MTDSQKARLAEIELEFSEMKVDRTMIREYMRLSAHFPGPAIKWPEHQHGFYCLPNGAIPHDIYERTLEDLQEGLQRAKDAALAAEVQIEMISSVRESEKKLMPQGRVFRQNDNLYAQQIEMYKKQIAEPAVLKQKLYSHLMGSWPIDAKAFFDKLDALIDEEMSILADIKKASVKAIKDKYNASNVSHV